MISINEWVNDNARRPIIRLLVLYVVAQVLYFGYLTYTRYTNLLARAALAAESISLGVAQSNRPLIESSVLALLGDSNVASVALCAGAIDTISYPQSAGGYCRQGGTDKLHWKIIKPLVGGQGLILLIGLSPSVTLFPLLAILTITLLISFAIVSNTLKISKKLEMDVFAPLYAGFNNESAFHIKELEEFRQQNAAHLTLVKDKAAADAMVVMAAQVAHDIRSPLAALGAAAKGLELLPVEQRSLIEGSVSRMQGIADDLLQRYRAPSAGQAAAKTAIYALGGLIEQVLSEKRLQHKDKTGLKIEFNASPVEIKALVEPKELQRLLSNLINNSVEAFAGPGKVEVSLSALDGKVLIEVKDNGKGIPPEILAKLGRKGETHGKAGGTGLGLYHARVSVESWGGSLKITSKAGKGTTVSITLPAAARPAAGLRAALLDDDPLVHMNWRLAAKAAGAWLQSFKTPQEFTVAAETLPRDIPLYIDSDLGNDIKGEEIAKDLREKGFTDITMATGHGAEKFSHLPWLKVAGKEPPWA